MFLINLNTEIVACILSFRKSRHKPNVENTTKYGFSPDLGGKIGDVLSMRMQVILDYQTIKCCLITVKRSRKVYRTEATLKTVADPGFF